MNNFIYILTILSGIFFLTSGCTGTPKQAPIKYQDPVVYLENESPYYYFTEAQLHQKRGNLDKAIFFLKKAIENDPEAAILLKELATFYLQQNDRDNALQTVEKILDRDPDDVAALIIYARIKHSLKQTDGAKEAYEKVINQDPTQENIYLHLGGIYWEEGNLDKAFKTYSKLLQHFPSSYAGHFFLGKIHLQRNQMIKAEEEFKKTLELEPKLEEPRFELLELYKAQGKNDEVIGMYQVLLKKNQNNIRALIAFGYFYHEIGDLNAAEEIFKDLGIRSGSDQNVVQVIAKDYLDKKKYDAVFVILEGLLKGAGDSSDLHYLAGLTYNDIDDKDSAIGHFMQVGPGSRFYESAVVHIAYIYQEQDKVREGINFLTDVIERVPDNPEFFLQLGSLYEDAEDFGEALKVLQKGIEIDSKNVRLYFRLGVVYDKRGHKKDSIRTMKTVISLDPQNANALNYLGYTYADLGQNLNEAEQLIKKALQFKPADGYITDSLGWVYYKKGLFDQAIEVLEQAVELVPDDPIILEHLGDAYLKTNNKEKALEFYQRSLLHKKEDRIELERKIRELSKDPG
ncbi:tetratricopeptide repeat protein [Thermodesulfobacteriota bacterium]